MCWIQYSLISRYHVYWVWAARRERGKGCEREEGGVYPKPPNVQGWTCRHVDLLPPLHKHLTAEGRSREEEE